MTPKTTKTRMNPVRIKPRRTAVAGSVETEKPAFPTIEAKPKEPLPPARFEGLDPRRLGQLAIACRDETNAGATDDRFTAGDYVRNLRTPYDPKNSTEARYRNRVRNRATGITAKCVDCAGSRKNVTECAAVECPLWAFRNGKNPFRRKV